MPLKLPIGYDVFGEVIEQNFDLIDKTLLIKEIIDDETKVALITRPRRFGKTLNLSMLHHFLVKEAYGFKTKGIFDKFKIAKVDNGKYMEHQGKYPVIFVTLKDIKDDSFQHAYACLCQLVGELFREHYYLSQSDRLNPEEKKIFHAFAAQNVPQERLEKSFKILCEYLHKHHGVRPWLLIDEYDTPLQTAYLHGYYNDMIHVIRNLFGSALKTNPHLYKSVITGILRISKESIFSELNNLAVYSIFRKEYSQYFGFTEDEVEYILQQTDLKDKAEGIKQWYNGYQFGGTVVYNPWSIVNCVKTRGELQPYWVSTSGNDLIKQLIVRSSVGFKKNIDNLIKGLPINVLVDEHVTFADLKGAATGTASEFGLWGLLLAAGYLKVIDKRIVMQGLECTLAIPNYEIRTLYCRIIEQWLSPRQSYDWYMSFLGSLLDGDVEMFGEYLQTVMLQIVSVHDVAKEPEAFYHGLMLGFSVSLTDRYEVKSNKESGRGRYDVALIPKDATDATKKAIIMEFKSVTEVKDLPIKAQEALDQIAQKSYESEIKARGIENIVKMGIAFCGKELMVVGQ